MHSGDLSSLRRPGTQGNLHYLQNREPDLYPKTSSFCPTQVALDSPRSEISERGREMKTQVQEKGCRGVPPAPSGKRGLTPKSSRTKQQRCQLTPGTIKGTC